MINHEIARTVFEDNDILTIDDGDFDSLFLASAATDDTGIIDDICAIFNLYVAQINDEFVAIFAVESV